MTRAKGLAVAFYVGAVAAGAVVGITMDRWVLRERLVHEWSDPRAMRTRLANELQLDDAQRAHLDSILDRRNRLYDELMTPMRPRLDSVSTTARRQIRDLLRPDQQALYDKMQREREEARRQERRR